MVDGELLDLIDFDCKCLHLDVLGLLFVALVKYVVEGWMVVELYSLAYCLVKEDVDCLSFYVKLAALLAYCVG